MPFCQCLGNTSVKCSLVPKQANTGQWRDGTAEGAPTVCAGPLVRAHMRTRRHRLHPPCHRQFKVLATYAPLLPFYGTHLKRDATLQSSISATPLLPFYMQMGMKMEMGLGMEMGMWLAQKACVKRKHTPRRTQKA